jgi:hypothetical protein
MQQGPILSPEAKSIKQKDNIGIKQPPNNQTTTNQVME